MDHLDLGAIRCPLISHPARNGGLHLNSLVARNLDFLRRADCPKRVDFGGLGTAGERPLSYPVRTSPLISKFPSSVDCRQRSFRSTMLSEPGSLH